jgi:RHS repeat-associated protein
MSPCAAVVASGATTWSPAIVSGDWLVSEDWPPGKSPLPAGTGVNDPDYMHAREYKPWLGRFLTTDPAGESARPSDPQSWNRYAYANSNPLKYIDPDGKAAVAAVAIGGGIAIGTLAALHHSSQMQNNPEYREAVIAITTATHDALNLVVLSVGSRDKPVAPGRGAPPPTAIPGQRPKETDAPAPSPKAASDQPPQGEALGELLVDKKKKTVLDAIVTGLGGLLGLIDSEDGPPKDEHDGRK